MDRLKKLSKAAASVLIKLHTNATFQEAFESLLKLARSPFVKSLVGDDFDVEEIERMLNYVRENQLIYDILTTVGDLLECLSVDRFEAVESVEQLRRRAYELNQQRLFLAALNFEDVAGKEITYKIHMDTDNTQPTFENKNRFWFPGPAASMIVDLKYHRGFVQLMQLVDLGIIKHKRLQQGPLEDPQTETSKRPSIQFQSVDGSLFDDDDDDDFDLNDEDKIEQGETTTIEPLDETTIVPYLIENETITTQASEVTNAPDVILLSDGADLPQRAERVRRSDVLSLLNSFGDQAELGARSGRVKRQGLLDLLTSFTGGSSDSKEPKFDIDEMQFYTKQFPYPAYISDE